MQDQTYRQIYRMKALDRWENEGGRIDPHHTGKVNAGQTDEQVRAINGGQHSMSENGQTR